MFSVYDCLRDWAGGGREAKHGARGETGVV